MILKITSGLLKSSRLFALVLLALLVVYLLIGRVFVFTAANNKDRIETLLHESGMQYLEIGKIEGDWHVFDPVFELSDVQFKKDGETVFAIDTLRLRLNSARSALKRAVIVSDMEVSGLRFTLIGDAEGFRIKGFTQRDGEIDLKPILDSIPYIRAIELSDIDISLLGKDHQLRLASRPGEPWIVEGEGAGKQISFPLYLERLLEGGERLETRLHLVGSYEGDLRSDNFSSQLYLSAPEVDLANFLPDIEVYGQHFSNAILSSEVWLKVSPRAVDAVGLIQTRDIGLTSGKEPTPFADVVSAEFRFVGESFTQGQFAIPSLRLEKGRYSFQLDDISIAVGELLAGRSIAAEIPQVDVSDLVGLIQFAGEKSLVPERLSHALAAVEPSGSLNDLAFLINVDGGKPRLVGRLDDISMQAYLGLPAINHLNGFINFQPDRGYLDINNDVFDMSFSSLFSSAWPFDSGRGRISYLVEDGQFKVSSGLIELVAGELAAYGKVALNLPGNRDLQTWGLTLGVSNARLLDTNRYLPNNISPELIEWLESAVQGGRAVESGMTFHGALFRGAPKIRKSHDLYFSVAEGVMAYHRDWPRIEDVTGTVHVTTDFVHSKSLNGRVFDSEVLSAKVDVPLSRSGEAHTVLVQANARGPFSDIVRVLNETPLREMTSGIASTWNAGGTMTALMTLDVPIGPRKNQEVASDVLVNFSDTSLNMPEYNLFMETLEGSVAYSTLTGLSSKSFTGKSFDEPVQGSITTVTHGDGGEIAVSVDGRISAPQLYEWSEQLLLSRARGYVDYSATVHVPYGGNRDEPYVTASSNLVGLTLDLPYPLSKARPESAVEFTYTQLFQDSGVRIDMSLDDDIRASLKIEDGIAVGGRMHFGNEPFGAVAYDGIRMSGHLDTLDYEQWMQVTDELGQLAEVSLEDEIAEHVELVELSIDELLLFSLPLVRAEVSVTRQEGAWLAHLENEMLVGSARVADDEHVPININLQRLTFAEDGDQRDPLEDVDPLSIGAIDFSTDLLEIGEENYGKWAFKFRPEASVAVFETLSATLEGLEVLPTSRLEWQSTSEGHETQFNGSVRVDDLAAALKKFGFAASIEGKDLLAHADIGWTGSPAMVDVMQVVGPVEIDKGEGRFVQAETGGALKLLGIFDFASLARRFRLDFSDVIDKGFEFSDISGATSFNKGTVAVTDPIVIDGSSGKFTVGGVVDLASGVLDNEMIVTLPVGRTLPWYAAYSAIATGPLAGAGVMLAQKVFQSQIDQMSSAKYKVSGTMEEPVIDFVAIFDDKVAERTAETPLETP